MDSHPAISARDRGIEFVCEYSTLPGDYGKQTLCDQIPSWFCFLNYEPFMPKKDGVYWCSLGKCMTSDNNYS